MAFRCADVTLRNYTLAHVSGDNARFPPFRCRFAVPVSRCRFRILLPLPLSPLPLRISMPWLVGVDDWLASYGTTATEKIELDPISTEERLRQLFAVYGCNGTEFSYV